MASPMDVLKVANTQFPASKIVWAAIAVSAAVALISSFNLGLETLIPGAIFVLIIIVAFAIVSLFYRMIVSIEKLPGANILAGVIAWSFTIFTLGFIAGLMSCFFFGFPRELQELVFRGLEPVQETQTTDVETIGQSVEPVEPLPEPDADLETQPEELSANTSETDEVVRSLSVTDLRAQSRDACLDSIDNALPLSAFEQAVRDCQEGALQ